jgi:hypothetical protein
MPEGRGILAEIGDDTEILKEAIKRNSTHGQQLAKEEKKNLARKLWESTTVVEIASLLSVSTGIVSSWTTDLEDTRKDEEKQKVIGLYLKCHTQTEIGKELGQSEGNISKILTKFKNEKMKDFNENTTKPPDSFQIYDIWNFSKLDQQLKEFQVKSYPKGELKSMTESEYIQWLDNLTITSV